MPKSARKHGSDLRAVARLATLATTGVTTAVEAMHHAIGSGPSLLGKPLAGPSRLYTGIVYGTIRGVTELVGKGLERAFEELEPWLGESVPGPEREAVQAALNGVLGDYLRDASNPLAIETTFRRNGEVVDLTREGLASTFPQATRKVLVLVHGSSMNDLQWRQKGHDHGEELAKLGFTPVYLHYNSGLHISESGRALANLLETLWTNWPGGPPKLSLLGHSMGGLVARSACHVAEREGLHWQSDLERLVTLGTPHHGSPLERGGTWMHALLGVTDYSSPLAALAKIRSAGVTDLRFGNVIDEHWQGRDRFSLGRDERSNLPLPSGVDCHMIAATTAKAPRARLPSDGLVPVASALGEHDRPDLTLQVPAQNKWIAYGTSHVELLSRPEVYERLKAIFSRAPEAAPSRVGAYELGE